MGNENIDTIKQLAENLDVVIKSRNLLIELRKGDHSQVATLLLGPDSIGITELGADKILVFLIELSNKRITELKKDISNSLYPTTNE